MEANTFFSLLEFNADSGTHCSNTVVKMKALIILSLVAVSFAGELYEFSPLVNCDDSNSITKVLVENCADRSICKLTKGHNTTMKITMIAPKNVKNVKALVTGLVGDAELPFPGLNRYVCRDPANAGFCPQEKGKEYTVTIQLPILKLFPNIKTSAFVRFIDDDASSEAEEKLACVKMGVELIDDPNAPKESAATPPSDEDDE